jgi:dihydroorotase
MAATPDNAETARLEIAGPDDWHVHFRDADMMRAVVPETTQHFSRALVMPNLVPPVVTVAEARAYRDRIMACLPRGSGFTPLMTLYLTEQSRPDDVAAGHEEGLVAAVKLYPAGATTNSASGVRDLDRVMPVLDRMAANGIPLSIHGEVTDPATDIFDREAIFIDTVLDPLRRRLPDLRITLEHVTTAEGTAYVAGATRNLAATITAHHLVINRNHILAGGIRPHYYCLPVAKRESHRRALVAAATSGDPRFFLGTDSAPHAVAAKEAACGCAGCFTAPVAMSVVAEVFDLAGTLDRLEAFTSLSGAAWHGLPPNDSRLTLVRHAAPLPVPDRIGSGAGQVQVFDPGFPLHWSVL